MNWFIVSTVLVLGSPHSTTISNPYNSFDSCLSNMSEIVNKINKEGKTSTSENVWKAIGYLNYSCIREDVLEMLKERGQ